MTLYVQGFLWRANLGAIVASAQKGVEMEDIAREVRMLKFKTELLLYKNPTRKFSDPTL